MTADQLTGEFETIQGGAFFPLFAGAIPSFDEVFERYAADLKREAETIQQSRK